MATPARSQKVKPPEKGAFPLDHDGECKPAMKEFLACLKEHDSDHLPCKILSKEYLQCRMDKGLMLQEDMTKLGFAPPELEKEYRRLRETAKDEAGKREEEGFVAGTGVRNRRRWWFW